MATIEWELDVAPAPSMCPAADSSEKQGLPATTRQRPRKGLRVPITVGKSPWTKPLSRQNTLVAFAPPER